MKITEKDIENANLRFLKYTPGFLVFKKNNGAVFDPTKKTFRKAFSEFQPNGASDLYGSYYGRALFIEIKKPAEYKYIMKHYLALQSYVGKDKNKSRYRDQILFIERNKANGCIAFFSDSVETTLIQFEAFDIHLQRNPGNTLQV